MDGSGDSAALCSISGASRVGRCPQNTVGKGTAGTPETGLGWKGP